MQTVSSPTFVRRVEIDTISQKTRVISVQQAANVVLIPQYVPSVFQDGMAFLPVAMNAVWVAMALFVTR